MTNPPIPPEGHLIPPENHFIPLWKPFDTPENHLIPPENHFSLFQNPPAPSFPLPLPVTNNKWFLEFMHLIAY